MGLDPLPVWRMVRTTADRGSGSAPAQEKEMWFAEAGTRWEAPHQSMDRTAFTEERWASNSAVRLLSRSSSEAGIQKRSRPRPPFFEQCVCGVFSFLYVCTFRQEAVFSDFRRP